ncbi:MAG: hypothetical protein VB070_06630 [Clostridiaceae bacterium]|nr:hypothetical protein [Clostridiaceae bacterium]
MKMTHFRRMMLLVLSLSLILFSAACQPTPTTTGSTNAATTTAAGTSNTTGTSAAATDVVTLTGFSMYGNNTVDEAGWYTKYLLENLGIKLEFMTATDATQMMQSLMASGELPDIVGFNSKTFSKNAAEAGLLLCLDDYQDKLPNLFGSNGQFQYGIDFYRANVSDATHKLYAVPTSVGVMDLINYDPQLRWDIYQQIGSPKIATLEDYLPVLKAMVDAYPKTDDGLKTYGISLFPSWDGRSMANATYVSVIYGVDSEYSCNLCETPVDGSGTPIEILDNDSQYKRVLKFFFKANQMGILDPDSATQTWDIIVEKWGKGRIMFSPWNWSVGDFNVPTNTNVDNFKGYASVWPEDAKQGIYPDQYVGSTWDLALSSSTKNVDAALRFFDFYYSFEGMDLVLNGPQGVIWDVDSQGMRYVTDAGWDILENKSGAMPDGGKLGAAVGIINAQTISSYTKNPATSGQTMGYSLWETSLTHNPTKLVINWRAANGGYANSLALAKATNRVVKSTQAVKMVTPADDDMTAIMNQIGDVLKTASWQMVFAKDEAEFEAIWAKAQSDADGLGMEKVMTWFLAAWQDALTNAKKYQP